MMRLDRGRDRGAVAVFFALQGATWVLLASLIVVGGGRVRAHQRAYNIAAEAARIGGQVIDEASAIRGVVPKRIDEPRAKQAVKDYLTAAGVTDWTVTIQQAAGARPATVVVTATIVFENPTGIRLPDLDSVFVVTGTATATLVFG